MTADRDAAPAAAEGADDELYEGWRAAVLAHERMCIEVDIYTPKDVYAAYLVARTREIEAALALRRAAAPLGLGVTGAARPAPAPAPRDGDDARALLECIRELRTAAYGNAHGCAEQDRIFEMAQRVLERYEHAAREAARGDG